MGVSTDAYMAFGFDLGAEDDGDLPAKLEAWLKEDEENYLGEFEDKEFPEISILHHCHHEYAMWFLHVGKYFTAWRGSPTEVTFETLPDAVDMLKRFCDKWEIEYQTPKWHIMSNWG